jgi:hypothetical protein
MLVAAGLGMSEFLKAAPASAAIVWQHPFTFRAHVSSPFGTRIDPFTGQSRMHYGLDYSGPPAAGTPIYAVAAGMVTSSGFNAGGFGNNVTIDHGDGYASVYGHMQDGTRLPQNAAVTLNTIVGRVGSTGRSTGNHLHLEIHRNGVPIDPRPFIDNAPLATTTPSPSPTYQEGDDLMLIRNSARGDFFASPGIVKKSPNPNVFNMLAAGGIPIVTIVDSNIDAVLMAFAGPAYTYADDLYVNPRLLTPGT